MAQKMSALLASLNQEEGVQGGEGAALTVQKLQPINSVHSGLVQAASGQQTDI